jgi:hypothetical protein
MTDEDRILAAYLSEVARVHATGAGTGETSYYGALQGVLNTIGAELNPHIYCLSQMSGGSAGYPDFGLFVEQQFSRGQAVSWTAGGPAVRALVKASPDCKLLMSVPGIGALSVLAYVSTVEDPARIRRSRSVGAHCGLTPR